jgi:hypothetical protein
MDRSQNLRSSSKFMDLPLEIRITIWKLSLEPRIVTILHDRYKIYYSRAKIPPALHVCGHSRDAVIGLYPTCFGSWLYPKRVMFNFSIDTLYLPQWEEFNPPHFFTLLQTAELVKIRSFAIESEIAAYLGVR